MDVFLSITSTTDGSVQEVRYSLSESLVVGRGAEGGVLLEGPDLSREHLAFTSEGSNVYVTDLSVNGTWVNGRRLRKSVRQRISPEDSIELPGYVLKYRSADQPELVEDAPSDQTSHLLAEDKPPAVACWQEIRAPSGSGAGVRVCRIVQLHGKVSGHGRPHWIAALVHLPWIVKRPLVKLAVPAWPA